MILSAFCFSILLLQRPFDYIVRQNSKRLAIFQKFFKIFNKKAHCIRNKLSGTRNGNRTHNYPLGGGYYIHLTMQAYYAHFSKRITHYLYIVSQTITFCNTFAVKIAYLIKLSNHDFLNISAQPKCENSMS